MSGIWKRKGEYLLIFILKRYCKRSNKNQYDAPISWKEMERQGQRECGSKEKFKKLFLEMFFFHKISPGKSNRWQWMVVRFQKCWNWTNKNDSRNLFIWFDKYLFIWWTKLFYVSTHLIRINMVELWRSM